MQEVLPSWNLTHFFDSPEDPRLAEAIEAIVPAAEKFEARWRGKLKTTDAALFKEALEDYERTVKSYYRPYGYAHLRFSLDSGLAENVALLDRVRRRANDAGRKILFFTLEPDALGDEEYRRLAEDPLLAPWSHYLSQSRLQKKHRLTEPEESVIALKTLTGKSAFVQLYSRLTSAMRFASPVEEGKFVTGAELLAFQKNPDPGIRRKAVEIYAAEYEKEKLVISSVWNALALDHGQELALRGYSHPMEPTNLGNELSQKAVDSLMEATRRNYHLAGRYYRWKAGILGMERLSTADLSAPLPGGPEKPLPFDEAKGMVLEAFSAFHESFHSIAKAFFDEGRIDAAPREGKSGGAFCMAVSPDLPVYVLMNHTGKLRDAATLAHELGHGIHFTLARKQPLLEYDAVLPMAETASVFGELLLTRKLLQREMGKEERRNLLAERVEDILATTFRQSMYTDFELSAHLANAEAPLSPEEFCALWKTRLEELYGDSVEILPGSVWSWSAIPHFIHTRFYCYAYTFGELLVLALYGRYQKEGDAFAPKMIKLLEAGGSLTPSGLLAEMGYDLEDPAFWEGGYRVLEDLIGELEKL